MQLDLATHSNIGGRDENEDSILALQTEGFILAAVADGLGGHGGGKIASTLAIETLREQGERLKTMQEDDLRAVCEEINQRILAEQTPMIRMKTTLALALVCEDSLAFPACRRQPHLLVSQR